jgi:hypothetical protein
MGSERLAAWRAAATSVAVATLVAGLIFLLLFGVWELSGRLG